MDKKKSKQHSIEQLEIDLKRLLKLNKITTFTLESIKTNRIVQPWLSDACNKVINSHTFIEREIRLRDDAGVFPTIKAALEQDIVHDIALHMDLIMKLDNVAEATAIIEEKFPQ